MSPTSYQAAPPRTNIIADGGSAVKRYRIEHNLKFAESLCEERAAGKNNRLIRAAHQELYGVLSNGETVSDWEFTSLIP